MECKDFNIQYTITHVKCINRNIVECKVEMIPASAVAYGVLIETLWNVKCKTICGLALTDIRINRNIVECKAGKSKGYVKCCTEY